ncbi:hypothetical protein C2845_PM03G35720 [Panicum miliaceum]|uniref:Uncharacterized protein n=1 Tax=Panicum miliaceum TaxID=4540 RepID=A0A3L6TDR7_PANMI|nr:hypothetical protein C2845_PM03G35720 [Panicum miliaceum]
MPSHLSSFCFLLSRSSARSRRARSSARSDERDAPAAAVGAGRMGSPSCEAPPPSQQQPLQAGLLTMPRAMASLAAPAGCSHLPRAGTRIRGRRRRCSSSGRAGARFRDRRRSSAPGRQGRRRDLRAAAHCRVREEAPGAEGAPEPEQEAALGEGRRG